MASDYANDMATLEIEENFPLYRWNWQGKTPMDISFKLDEETEIFDPIMNEKMKALATKSGNKLLFTQKYSGTFFGVFYTRIKPNKCMNTPGSYKYNDYIY